MDSTGWVWGRKLTIRHRTEAAPHEVLHALSHSDSTELPGFI
jgi:hypothetical protein